MTPYEIDILLHYYSRANDHADISRDPPIWRPTIKRFLGDDVLRYLPEGDRARDYPVCYVLTDRGRAYVEALLCVPLPEKKVHWVFEMPVTFPARFTPLDEGRADGSAKENT